MDNMQTIGIVTPSTKLVTYSTTHKKPKFDKFTHECIKEFFTSKLYTTAGDPQFSEAGISYCFLLQKGLT